MRYYIILIIGLLISGSATAQDPTFRDILDDDPWHPARIDSQVVSLVLNDNPPTVGHARLIAGDVGPLFRAIYNQSGCAPKHVHDYILAAQKESPIGLHEAMYHHLVLIRKLDVLAGCDFRRELMEIYTGLAIADEYDYSDWPAWKREPLEGKLKRGTRAYDWTLRNYKYGQRLSVLHQEWLKEYSPGDSRNNWNRQVRKIPAIQKIRTWHEKIKEGLPENPRDMNAWMSLLEWLRQARHR